MSLLREVISHMIEIVFHLAMLGTDLIWYVSQRKIQRYFSYNLSNWRHVNISKMEEREDISEGRQLGGGEWIWILVFWPRACRSVVLEVDKLLLLLVDLNFFPSFVIFCHFLSFKSWTRGQHWNSFSVLLASWKGHFSDLAMAASGHGGYCEDGVPTEAALLAILAAFAVSFAILYMASTTNTGRKKREITLSDMLKDVMWSGKYTVFENHGKSRIQHCERSELRLHFEWTKVH